MNETANPQISGQKISDAALSERTGRDWDSWFTVLDNWGANKREHAEIATWLVEEHGVAGWWAQSITVGYEQARGMRAPGQGSDGKFSASGSKTVNVPVERLFEAFADESIRSRWLPDASISVRTATSPKTFRADWKDGTTRIAAFFTAKGDAKSQVSLEHEKLADSDEASEKKAYWRERLNALKKVLESE